MNVKFNPDFPLDVPSRVAIRRAIEKSLGIKPDPNQFGLPGMMPASTYSSWAEQPEVQAARNMGFHVTPGFRRCTIRHLDPETWNEVTVAEGSV